MLGNVIEGTVGGELVPAARFSATELDAVPASAEDAGLPTASLATFSNPEKVPATADVKVTVIEQFAPMASVAPQVLPVTAKSLWLVPPIVTPLIFTTNWPVFVSVAVSGCPADTRPLKVSVGVSVTNFWAPGLAPIKLVFSIV